MGNVEALTHLPESVDVAAIWSFTTSGLSSRPFQKQKSLKKPVEQVAEALEATLVEGDSHPNDSGLSIQTDPFSVMNREHWLVRT